MIEEKIKEYMNFWKNKQHLFSDRDEYYNILRLIDNNVVMPALSILPTSFATIIICMSTGHNSMLFAGTVFASIEAGIYFVSKRKTKKLKKLLQITQNNFYTFGEELKEKTNIKAVFDFLIHYAEKNLSSHKQEELHGFIKSLHNNTLNIHEINDFIYFNEQIYSHLEEKEKMKELKEQSLNLLELEKKSTKIGLKEKYQNLI